MDDRVFTLTWACSREQNPALDMVEFWNDIAERVGGGLLFPERLGADPSVLGSASLTSILDEILAQAQARA